MVWAIGVGQGSKDGVNGVEDVAEHVESLLAAALCCCQKVIHVDVNIGEQVAVMIGLLQGVGYGCAGQGWCKCHGGGWVGQGSGHGLAFQVVWCCWFVVLNVMVGNVGNGLHGSKKYGWQVFPTHRKGDGKGHEFWFMQKVWEGNPELWDVEGAEADLIEPVGKIYF